MRQTVFQNNFQKHQEVFLKHQEVLKKSSGHF